MNTNQQREPKNHQVAMIPKTLKRRCVRRAAKKLKKSQIIQKEGEEFCQNQKEDQK